MKPLIVRTDPEVKIVEGHLEGLIKDFDLVTCDDDREETILAAVPEASLILTCYASITRSVIEAASQLKGIVKYGVGVDSIDLAAATDRGVYVANAPDYGTETVADHAFALLMALSRKLPTISRAMRSDGWIWPHQEVLATDVFAKTLGLVGFGRIGRAMARRAHGFGMRVLAFDPHVQPEEFARLGVTPSSLQQVFEEADAVSLHCVLTPETRGIVSLAQLQSMQRTAFLVNVSRGALIDRDALCQALDQRWIAGAACDVFESEPLAGNDPLAGRDNVILTPHLAWYTTDALDRLDADTVGAIRQILSGQVPDNLKNREVLDLVETRASGVA